MKLFYNYLDHVTLALGIKGKKKIKIHKHEFPFKNSELWWIIGKNIFKRQFPKIKI